MLLGCGHLRIDKAVTGAEGLHLARSLHPDVVVLDLKLPTLGDVT